MIGSVAFEKISAEDFKWLQGWLKGCSSIVMEDGRKFVAEKRLHPLLWKHKIPSFGELCRFLRQGVDSALHADAIEALTAGETWFYRDPSAFELLRTQIIPALMKLRQESRELSFWCAGCSTGQEAYSLALLIQDMPQLSGWKVNILGTDLSQRQIDRARQGIYTREEVNRGLPSALLTPNFQQDGMVWTARESLKAKVQFKTLRLDEAWDAMPAFDLILMRNVLFHFDEASRLELLWRMRKQLTADGCLMLGSQEKNDLDEGFEQQGNEKSWYYRRTQMSPVAKAA